MNVVSAVFSMLCSWSLSGLLGCGPPWAWRIITKTRWLKLFNTARFWALRHYRTSHQISVDKDQTLNISASIDAFLLLLQTFICLVSYFAFFSWGTALPTTFFTPFQTWFIQFTSSSHGLKRSVFSQCTTVHSLINKKVTGISLLVLCELSRTVKNLRFKPCKLLWTVVFGGCGCKNNDKKPHATPWLHEIGSPNRKQGTGHNLHPFQCTYEAAFVP